MEIEIKKINNVHILYPSDHLNINSSRDLEKTINEVLKQDPHSHILINLSNVESVSSSGLRIFLYTKRKLKEYNLELRLCQPNENIMATIQLISLDDIIDIHMKEEEALKLFP